MKINVCSLSVFFPSITSSTQTWIQNKTKQNTIIKRKTQHSIKTCAYNECCTRH